ncbi:MAG: aldo/keto reductase [Actinomycetales bacterium]|nr:aldo/keto reductase [Actinomycetales bacterium]
MEQRVVGRTGLRVSSLGLGTMTWGRDTDPLDAATMLTEFVEAGGTLVDTAAGYADGAAEELLGELLAGTVARSDVVLVTKAGVRTWRSDRAVVDASRGTLLDSLDASLSRLGTDHVDVFLVQAPDPFTPMEETAGALRAAVTSGRARYAGLSNHSGWQCAHMAGLLRPDPGLAVVENEYSLLERGIERELLPAAQALGIGVFAWSPLGRGVLTAKYRHSTPPDSRAASPHLRAFVAPYLDERSFGVVEALVRAADGLECHPLEVALAWVRSRGVASAIVGPRTPGQLRAILASDVEVPDVIARALSDVS